MRSKQANGSRKNRQGRGLARRALTLAVAGILALSPLLTAEEAAAADAADVTATSLGIYGGGGGGVTGASNFGAGGGGGYLQLTENGVATWQFGDPGNGSTATGGGTFAEHDNKNDGQAYTTETGTLGGTGGASRGNINIPYNSLSTSATITGATTDHAVNQGGSGGGNASYTLDSLALTDGLALYGGNGSNGYGSSTGFPGGAASLTVTTLYAKGTQSFTFSAGEKGTAADNSNGAGGNSGAVTATIDTLKLGRDVTATLENGVKWNGSDTTNNVTVNTVEIAGGSLALALEGDNATASMQGKTLHYTSGDSGTVMEVTGGTLTGAVDVTSVGTAVWRALNSDVSILATATSTTGPPTTLNLAGATHVTVSVPSSAITVGGADNMVYPATKDGLQAAMDDIAENGVITLAENVSMGGTATIAKDVTINLNDKRISATAAMTSSGVTPITVTSPATLTITGSGSINAGAGATATGGNGVTGTVNVTGSGTVNITGNAGSGGGSGGNGVDGTVNVTSSGAVNITGGAGTNDGNGGNGVDGTVNVTSSGAVNITGGTGGTNDGSGGNGVDGNVNVTDSGTVNITGGAGTSDAASGGKAITGNITATGFTVTESDDNSNFVDVAAVNGVYTSVKRYVTVVFSSTPAELLATALGGNTFATVEADGATVTLLQDVTLSGTATIASDGVTLNLNGKRISGGISNGVGITPITVTGPATLTITGSGSINGGGGNGGNGVDGNVNITGSGTVSINGGNGNSNSGKAITGNITATGFTVKDSDDNSNFVDVTATNGVYTSTKQYVTVALSPTPTPPPSGDDDDSGDDDSGVLPPSGGVVPMDKAPSVVEGAKPGDSVKVDVGTGGTLPSKVLDALAGKNVTLEVTSGGVTWTIKGTDLPKGQSFAALNLAVNTKSTAIPVAVINKLTGQSKTMQLSLSHNGPFGFAMTLQLEVGKENAGLWANLYYFNVEKKALEFRTSAKIGTDGKAPLLFDHASDYAVVIDTKNVGALPFADVAEGEWCYDAVRYVYENGLFSGVTDTSFAPNVPMTRAMLWTVLARKAGQDVTGDELWYTKSQAWAMAQAVSDGTNPNESLTREQMVTILYRYAGSPAVSGTLAAFSDASSVSGYAGDATVWAVTLGILQGNGERLNPQGQATRAQVATMLMRYLAQ